MDKNCFFHFVVHLNHLQALEFSMSTDDNIFFVFFTNLWKVNKKNTKISIIKNCIKSKRLFSSSMAQSVKIDFNVWSQFDHHAYDIMTEDFVHNNLFKFNANILTEKGRVRLQETLIQKEDKLDTTGEANIWFPLMDNKSLYFQCRPKGFRVHFDNGLLTRGHLLHNFYASVESDRNLSDHLFKIGCETIA